MYPNRHKAVFLTWLSVYFTVTLLASFLAPILVGKIPIYLFTLILTGIAVPVVSYILMPLMMKVFGTWVMRRTPEFPPDET